MFLCITIQSVDDEKKILKIDGIYYVHSAAEFDLVGGVLEIYSESFFPMFFSKALSIVTGRYKR